MERPRLAKETLHTAYTPSRVRAKKPAMANRDGSDLMCNVPLTGAARPWLAQITAMI